MLQKLRWDWIYFGFALLYIMTGLATHQYLLFVGAIYGFSLALRFGDRFELRTGVPMLMLISLLYVLETTPLHNYTESMIYTVQALILFRILILELRAPEHFWVWPIVLEFAINVILVYSSIHPLQSIPGIQYLIHFPGRVLGIVVGVQFWCRLKNTLILKKSS